MYCGKIAAGRQWAWLTCSRRPRFVSAADFYVNAWRKCFSLFHDYSIHSEGRMAKHTIWLCLNLTSSLQMAAHASCFGTVVDGLTVGNSLWTEPVLDCLSLTGQESVHESELACASRQGSAAQWYPRAGRNRGYGVWCPQRGMVSFSEVASIAWWLRDKLWWREIGAVSESLLPWNQPSYCWWVGWRPASRTARPLGTLQA